MDGERELQQTPQKAAEFSAGLEKDIFDEKELDLIRKICEKNLLSDGETTRVTRIVGDILLEFVQPNRLSSMIQERIHINPNTANDISTEIREKILDPDGLTATKKKSTIQPSSATTTIDKDQPEKREEPAPFMIHQETEIDQVNAPKHSGDLARPYFYKPTSNTEYSQNEIRRTPARLEIGELYNEPNSNQGAGATEVPQFRAIDYSGPQVKADPFERQVYEDPPTNEKSDVHPDNVVDLKDLPKENEV